QDITDGHDRTSQKCVPVPEYSSQVGQDGSHQVSRFHVGASVLVRAAVSLAPPARAWGLAPTLTSHLPLATVTQFPLNASATRVRACVAFHQNSEPAASSVVARGCHFSGLDGLPAASSSA